MYCKYCGKPIDDDSVYCPVCSRPQTSNRTQKDNREEEKTPPPPPTKVVYQNYVPPVFVSFVDAIKSYYTNFANFNGRATRSEYWWVTTYNVLVSLGVMVLFLFAPIFTCGLLTEEIEIWTSFYYMVSVGWSLVHLVPEISLTVRRLHDIGKSGFNYFWGFVPFVGSFVMLYYMCQSSSYYDNQWGPTPYSNAPSYEETTWYCAKCGARTPNSSKVCKGCNAEKPSAKQHNYEPTENYSGKCVCGERVYGDECPNCGRKMQTK